MLYAVPDDSHGGRNYPQEGHPYRTPFQRDRDRIIHSKAFRRLGYKTQVFLNSEGDIYRTRLTHSLEVAQIARSISYSLGLNQDLAEALALSHDLGHTPFGHTGQNVLNRLMKEEGGFEHNCQGLRQVIKLELRYPEFHGLNLCQMTLGGMMKHKRIYKCDTELEEVLNQRKNMPSPSLEAGLVDLCDRIAYTYHDLEDGLDSAILSSTKLLQQLPCWEKAVKSAQQKLESSFRTARLEVQMRTIIRGMLDESIRDLIETSRENLCLLSPSSYQEMMMLPLSSYPIKMSPGGGNRIEEIQAFLKKNLYRNPRVLKMSKDAAVVICFLFEKYMNFSQKMPKHYQERISVDGIHRTVSDYIAGMTDRFAVKDYETSTNTSLSTSSK